MPRKRKLAALTELSSKAAKVMDENVAEIDRRVAEILCPVTELLNSNILSTFRTCQAPRYPRPLAAPSSP